MNDLGENGTNDSTKEDPELEIIDDLADMSTSMKLWHLGLTFG